MLEQVRKYINEVEQFNSDKPEEIELFRIKYLSKKGGLLTELFNAFKTVPNDEKKDFGKILNILKDSVTDKINYLNNQIESNVQVKTALDLSLPGKKNQDILFLLLKMKLLKFLHDWALQFLKDPKLKMIIMCFLP